jgi:uncharacterized membrane protein YqjE
MDEAFRARTPAGRGGLFSSLLSLANALATFFETRAALFASESKRALVQLILLVASLVAALLSFALGYLFLVALIVAGVAHFLEISWEWSALGAAIIHFIFALVCLIVVATRMKRHPFPETAAELRKDREWLRNLDATSRPSR